MRIVRGEPVDVVAEPEHLQDTQQGRYAGGRIAGFELAEGLDGDADSFCEYGLAQSPAQAGRAQALTECFDLPPGRRIGRGCSLGHMQLNSIK